MTSSERAIGRRTAAAYAGLIGLPTLLGLVASSVLLVDYVRPAPVFCEEGGGCDAVRQTVFASLLGVPTPALGLAAFAALGALALIRGQRARLGHVVVATASALVAAFLVYVQFAIGAYCKFCLAVDASAMLVLAGAMLRAVRGWDPPSSARGRIAGALAMACAIALPLAVGFSAKVPIPEPIERELALTPKGQVTVVDFVDFECPFCRMTHAELGPIVAEHRQDVRIVRKQVPLKMHPHAMDAARAACCGEALGHGDAMADALFRAPVNELTPAGCEKIAETLGLDPAVYRACVADPKTEARIQSDTSQFHDSHGHGLPTIWIGDQRLEGAQPGEAYEKAMERALASQS